MTEHGTPDPQACAAARRVYDPRSASSLQQSIAFPSSQRVNPIKEDFIPDVPNQGGPQAQPALESGRRHHIRERENHQPQPQEQEQVTDRSYEIHMPATAHPTGFPLNIIERQPAQSVLDAQYNPNAGSHQPPCILILGATGVGKSSFIAATLGFSQVKVGHGVESCTSRCRDWKTPKAILIDTPGFNDTNRDDQDVLGEIGNRILSDHLPPITAVLYLHRIRDNRMSGSSLKNLKLMTALCGSDFYPRIAIATTMWNRVPETLLAQANARERELLLSYWEPILNGSGQYARFDGTRESGEVILSLFNSQPSITNKPMLQLEIECKAGHSIMDTAAGRIIQEEKLKRLTQLQRQIEDSREELQKEARQKQLSWVELGLYKLWRRGKEKRSSGQSASAYSRRSPR